MAENKTEEKAIDVKVAVDAKAAGAVTQHVVGEAVVVGKAVGVTALKMAWSGVKFATRTGCDFYAGYRGEVKKAKDAKTDTK